LYYDISARNKIVARDENVVMQDLTPI